MMKRYRYKYERRRDSFSESEAASVRCFIYNPFSAIRRHSSAMNSFTVLLVSVLFFSVHAQLKCGLQRGKRLTTFSGTRERLKFPCKYNAVRQQCGKYFVSITPGSDIRQDTGEYYESTMWVSIMDTTTGRKWEGRTSVKIAVKYLNNTVNRTPFHTKNKGLDITSICNYEKDEATNSVSLREKNNVFTITFGAYQLYGLKAKVSGWSFVCNDQNAVLASYPTHICGNLTEDFLKTIRLDLDFQRDNEVLMLNVFNDPSVIQTDDDCKYVKGLFTGNGCPGLEVRAIHECSFIVFDGKIYKDLIHHNFKPAEVFRICMMFVCSNYTDDASCEYLGEAMDAVGRISDKLAQKIEEKQCFPGFDPEERHLY